MIIEISRRIICTVLIASDKLTIRVWSATWVKPFIQYMPHKPIKQGIKVFAVHCIYTEVLLDFEVYCGSDSADGVD